jgi:hypothetical protein
MRTQQSAWEVGLNQIRVKNTDWCSRCEETEWHNQHYNLEAYARL